VRDRHAGERAATASLQFLVGALGGRERFVRRHGQEGVEVRVEARNALQKRARQLDAGKASRTQSRGELGDRQGVHE